MKKFSFVLIAVLALTGCQNQEAQQQQQQPSVDQRKDLGHKLILKSLNDLQNKDLKSTIIDLETSIKINPSEPEAYLLLGQILLKVQEYDHAADFLDEAGKTFPDNGTIFYMLSIANKMTGKKLPAVLAAKHSVEVFQAQQDRDNMIKSAALLQELIAMPDNQFVPAKKQDDTQGSPD
jgi:outer membrane protein assembly factor BamD (BamD/ComL family)